MNGGVKARYTLEFKRKAVRLPKRRRYTLRGSRGELCFCRATSWHLACGLRARGKREFKATTNSAHDLPVAPNLLVRNFAVAAPNRVWASDIAYILTEEGWFYLALVIDLFNRQVVGFATGQRMTRTRVMDALRMAWFRRHPGPGLIFHSDRGSQYASNDYRKLLRELKIESSISRKGVCWDNAVTVTLLARWRSNGFTACASPCGVRPRTNRWATS